MFKVVMLRDRKHGNILPITVPREMPLEHVLKQFNDNRKKPVHECDPDPYYEIYHVVDLEEYKYVKLHII